MSSGFSAESAKQKVSSAKNGINDINRQLDEKVRNRNNIGGRLSSIVNALGSIEAKLERIRRLSESNANNYLHADERVEAHAKDVAKRLINVSVPGVAGKDLNTKKSNGLDD